jgi:hypothetical protein
MRRPGLRAGIAIGVGLAALFFSLATMALTNDQFGRISPARQIARYGELPYRDFLDPGYILTEFSSAALLRVFGDTLLGEWLFTSLFMATGTVVVFVLAWRVSQSSLIALTAAAIALLSLPRAYDYDKVLFYPLGVALCWRYADRRDRRVLWMLAAGLVLSALFRYDTGVYIGCAALTVIGITHAGDWITVVRRSALLVIAVTCLSLPFLALLQYYGGVLNAIDQMVTYGMRESARTRISVPPRFSIGKLVGSPSIETTATPILVRWAESVDEPIRLALESQYQLRDGARDGEEANRTWSYRAEDTSVANLRRLLRDPRVEDTHGIDREKSVSSETFLTRFGRTTPILPGAWTFDNANAFLYHLLRWLPVVASGILLAGVASGSSGSRADVARIASLIVTCALLNVFILRTPVDARVGGMAGPAAILSAWMARRAWDVRSRVVRAGLALVTAMIVFVTVWSLSTAMEWERRLKAGTLSPGRVREQMSIFAESPPSSRAVPNSHLIGMVSYLRECTSVEDRLFAPWFAPELYFFAGRGFVGSVATFAGHWSEPRFQERIIDAFVSHSVPVVIIETAAHDDFVAQYSLVGQYLDEHYRVAGTTDFGNPEGNYTLLVEKNRLSSRTHPPTGMPCL